MEKRTRKTLLFIIFGVALYAALMNLSSVLAFAGELLSFFVPIGAGLIIAFVLSVPMTGFENLINRIFKKAKRKPQGLLLSIISFVLTLICLALILVLVCTVTIPEIKNSVISIADTIQKKWPEWMAYLDSYNINTEMIKEWFASINIENLTQTLTGSAGALLGSVVDVSVSIVSGVATTGISAVIAIYVLLSRHDLARQSKKFLYAYFSEKFAGRLCYVAKIIQDTYSKFFSGQCIEAVILGVLIVIAYSIFKIPYAGLIGILTGFFAFIPYVGAFAACFIGAVLIFIVDPMKALIAIAVYIVVQFIENQFIYPNVVGTSVGLSPLWTLVAALIGGNLFGLLGMIFFIPLVAVFYYLIREDIHSRLEKKASDENGGNDDGDGQSDTPPEPTEEIVPEDKPEEASENTQKPCRKPRRKAKKGTAATNA